MLPDLQWDQEQDWRPTVFWALQLMLQGELNYITILLLYCLWLLLQNYNNGSNSALHSNNWGRNMVRNKKEIFNSHIENWVYWADCRVIWQFNYPNEPLSVNQDHSASGIDTTDYLYPDGHTGSYIYICPLWMENGSVAFTSHHSQATDPQTF